MSFHLKTWALAVLLAVSAGCTGPKMEASVTSTPAPSSETTAPGDSLPAKGPTHKGHFRDLIGADLNGDGYPELITVNTLTAEIVIWHGSSHLNWRSFSTIPVHANVRALDVADLDGDARLDIIAALGGKGETGIHIWKNLGKFRFQKLSGPGKGEEFSAVFAIDLNFDGRADLLTGSEHPGAKGGIRIWNNLGPENWKLTSPPESKGPVHGIAATDFNQDGLLDIVAATGEPAPGLRVWLGKGKDFRWGAPNLLSPGHFWSILAKDLNGDSIPDIVATGRNTGIQIWQGLGKGVLNRMASPVDGGSFWRVAAVDRDGDGLMDLVASTMQGAGLRFWHQDRNLGWVEQRLLPTQGMYLGLDVADLDGDGRVDLGAATHGEGIPVWPGFGYLKPISTGQDGKRIKHNLPLIPGTTMPQLPGQKKLPQKSAEKIEGARPSTRLPGELVIGSGDLLGITIWQGLKPQRSEVLVSERGLISVGFLDDVRAAGLTLRELDLLLTAKLQKFIKHPRIDVDMVKTGSRTVRVMGTVARPQPVSMVKNMTVLDAILSAGGHITGTRQGDLTRVSLQRHGVTHIVNLLEYISKGGTQNNPLLQDGDLIYVPDAPPELEEKQRIFVFGEAKNPGVYAYSFNMRVLDAIAKANGFTEWARKGEIQIIRGDPERPEVIQSNIEAMLKKGDRRGNHLLKPNDVVYIPRTTIGDLNEFVKQISPLLDFLFYPARFRDVYALNTNVLKFDVGGPSAAYAERRAGGTFVPGQGSTIVLR